MRFWINGIPINGSWWSNSLLAISAAGSIFVGIAALVHTWRLEHHGIIAEAEVISHGGSTHVDGNARQETRQFVVYVFRLRDGREFRARKSMSEDFLRSHPVGSWFTVTYLPGDPGHNVIGTDHSYLIGYVSLGCGGFCLGVVGFMIRRRRRREARAGADL